MRRLGFLLLLLLGIFTAVQYLLREGYHLSYQDSKSLPEGWYVVLPLKQPIHRGETLVFTPPKTILPYLNSHHWLRPGTWMMKKVFGLPGDFVCIQDHKIWINHQALAPMERLLPAVLAAAAPPATATPKQPLRLRASPDKISEERRIRGFIDVKSFSKKEFSV